MTPGVGRAAALTFATFRPALVLAGRNEHILREVAAECEALGAATLLLATDVTDSAAVVRRS
jgi:NADP-dependent 3-hydroxy acid dehydrogenase YdfG